MNDEKKNDYAIVTILALLLTCYICFQTFKSVKMLDEQILKIEKYKCETK